MSTGSWDQLLGAQIETKGCDVCDTHFSVFGKTCKKKRERKKTINAEHKDDTVVVVHLSHFALLCTDERTLLLLESNTWKFP